MYIQGIRSYRKIIKRKKSVQIVSGRVVSLDSERKNKGQTEVEQAMQGTKEKVQCVRGAGV